jgi:hypothetical protein
VKKQANEGGSGELTAVPLAAPLEEGLVPLDAGGMVHLGAAPAGRRERNQVCELWEHPSTHWLVG